MHIYMKYCMCFLYIYTVNIEALIAKNLAQEKVIESQRACYSKAATPVRYSVETNLWS